MTDANNAISPAEQPFDADIERMAQRRAKAKIGWYIHATVFVLVNTLLLAISLSMGKHWAVFPLLGWGLGLALHGLSVWFLGRGSALRNRMVENERRALRQQRANA
jgi:hypothetical protein